MSLKRCRPDQQVRGLGPAGDGVAKGFFSHPVIAIDAEDSAVLGVAAAEIWTRDETPAADRQSRAFADKESARWLRGAQLAAERLASAASVVVVGDRESDIYEVFAGKPAAVDFIIRATPYRIPVSSVRVGGAHGRDAPSSGMAESEMGGSRHSIQLSRGVS